MPERDTAIDPSASRPSGGMRAGEVIAGAYRLEHALGAGGMGEVWAAQPLDGGVAVAVKVMLAGAEGADRLSRRFVREARTVGAIDSPHVTRLIDSGTLSDGRPFLVLELLEGEGLDQLIRRRAPLPIGEAVSLILQACEGVAEAHARGIVHRDLKPSNLFCTADARGKTVLKVLDFGIAKPTLAGDLQSDETSLTRSNALLGSPQYMSPEQIRAAHEVDGRADIWALGIILYKLLTGELPFEAGTVGEYFAVVLSGQPVALRRRRPQAPAGLERAIDRCLVKSASGRHHDIAALSAALQPFAPADCTPRVEYIGEIIEAARASVPSLRAAVGVEEAPTDEATAPDVLDRAVEAGAPNLATGTMSAAGGQWSTARNGSPRQRVWGVAALAVAVVAASWLLLRDGAPVPPIGPRLSVAAARAASMGGTPAAFATVRLSLHLTTPGTQLLLDGVPVSAGAPIELPFSESEHRLVASAPGYATSEHTFAADRDRYLDIALEPEPTSSSQAPVERVAAGRRAPAGGRLAALPPDAGALDAPPSEATATSPPSASIGVPPPRVDVGGPIEERL